jgi:hypothetical protein
VDHTFAHVLWKAQILLFLAQMGPSWSMPTLEKLSFPVFFSSLAAAQLLSHMPNLRYLDIRIEALSADLQPVFVALSKLKHPESVELMVAVDHYNIDGSWLAQLALKALKNLNCFWLISHNTSTAHISGAQLASFLVNHPKLNDLVMYLGPVEVLCSPEEKTAIDTCMAKMDKAEIGDMILTVQQPI